MTVPPAARSSSRRSVLTAALAGIAAGGATFGVQAATAEPDPVFVLIEVERRATADFHAAIDAQDTCKDDDRRAIVDAAWDVASEAQLDAFEAVMGAATTPAGVAAAIDLFVEREIDNIGRPVDGFLLDLFAAIGRQLGVSSPAQGRVV